ncbi:DNA/RNA helicase domain-containing protein [Streptomyces sp. NPDC052415]|uniref:DNA/RNA helicase domain-containing protein n=1 Tax=Streptomyces sp. NPDC052415 TaxID=3365690 RepID=UPI0037D85B05
MTKQFVAIPGADEPADDSLVVGEPVGDRVRVQAALRRQPLDQRAALRGRALAGQQQIRERAEAEDFQVDRVGELLVRLGGQEDRFCWEWKRPENSELLLEVRIGDWHRPWNAKDGVLLDDVPETSQWATDPRGFGQIGCIFTAQNFEFDWSGVIIGQDLVWQNGRFRVDRTKTHDGKLKQAKVSDEQVDRLVRHAYHVLLTRARKGIVIYAEDTDTRHALRELISGTVADSPLAKPAKKKLPTQVTKAEQTVAQQLAIEFD